MAAATLLLKSNPSLVCERRQHLYADLCYGVKSTITFSANSKFTSVKVKSFVKSTIKSTSRNNITFPFNYDKQSRNSNSQQISAFETEALKSISRTFKWLRIPLLVILQFFLLMMLIYGRHSAFARTGGSMGGHSFSSSSKSTGSSSSSKSSLSSSSSYSSSSRSSSGSSSPSSSSYSSSTRSSSGSSSPSSSSSSSSYSSSRRSTSSSSSPSSSSYSSSPRSSSSSSSPSSSSYSSSSGWSSSSSTRRYQSSSRRLSSEEQYVSTVASHSSDSTGQQMSSYDFFWLLVFLAGIIIWLFTEIIIPGFLKILSEAKSALNRFLFRITVTKLQVGLLVTDPTLQRDLNQIAETVDTSTSTGWIYILEETTKTLLQHSEYWISYYSSVDVKKSLEDAEARFKNLSIEERANFDEETVVNYSNNVKKANKTEQKIDQFKYTYMVVTVLVAAKGTHTLPNINNSEDLTKALQKLRSIHTSGELQAVNVVWTPQDVNDVMSFEELNLCYPHLKPF